MRFDFKKLNGFHLLSCQKIKQLDWFVFIFSAHSLGFYYEQSRPDRDDFVSINWDNIVESIKCLQTYAQAWVGLFSLYGGGNSFFQMSSNARANVRITIEKKNKRKIPMRAPRGLKWKNKMYKIKRSIGKENWTFFTISKLSIFFVGEKTNST